MWKFLDTLRKGLSRRKAASDAGRFRRQYDAFRRLLDSNNRALEIIADLEHHIYQDKPFTHGYALNQVESLVGSVNTIAEDLEALSGGKYASLKEVSRRIGDRVLSEMVRKRRFEEQNLVLPLERLSLENIEDVGGKAANLGEILNRAHLPVPPGFAITAHAYERFMEVEGLSERISARLKGIDIDRTEALMQVSHEIRTAIRSAPLPSELEAAIRQAARDLRERAGSFCRFSVRGSAAVWSGACRQGLCKGSGRKSCARKRG